MRVAVEDGGDRIPAERLFEPAGAEEWIDLERLAFDRRRDRRIVQDREARRCRHARERGLELQRLGNRLLDELFDHRLAPRAERASTESTTEPFNAGDADAAHFTGVAVEHGHAGVTKDRGHLI